MNESERTDALTFFLKSCNLDIHGLESEVHDAFGDPHLIVATGSVLAGFGNSESDIDLYAIVEHRSVIQLPIVSYNGEARIDVRYFSADEATSWDRFRGGPWLPVKPVTRDEWIRGRSHLEAMSRLAVGLPLAGTASWRAWRDELEAPWLTERIVQWWEAELYRRWVAAEIVGSTDIISQVHRWGEVALAILELRASELDERFFGTKWLGEKFKRHGDNASLAVLADILNWPDTTATDHFIGMCRELHAVAVAGRPVAPHLAVYASPGTVRREIAGRTFVSRWDMRSLEVAELDPAYEGEGPWWCGPAADLPEPMRALLAADLCWFSLYEGAP